MGNFLVSSEGSLLVSGTSRRLLYHVDVNNNLPKERKIDQETSICVIENPAAMTDGLNRIGLFDAGVEGSCTTATSVS